MSKTSTRNSQTVPDLPDIGQPAASAIARQAPPVDSSGWRLCFVVPVTGLLISEQAQQAHPRASEGRLAHPTRRCAMPMNRSSSRRGCRCQVHGPLRNRGAVRAGAGRRVCPAACLPRLRRHALAYLVPTRGSALLAVRRLPVPVRVTSGTVFEATAAADALVPGHAAAHPGQNNVSALELTRQLGVSYRTAWLVKHKLLQAMALAESERQLQRPRRD